MTTIGLAVLANAAAGQDSTAPSLSAPRLIVPGVFQFTLNGQSNVTYALEHSPDGMLWNWSTWSADTAATRQITLSSRPTAQSLFRAVYYPPPHLIFGIATRGLSVSADGVRIDSFDSTDPNYSSNGKYDPAKVADRADILVTLFSTDSGSFYASLGNVRVLGRVYTRQSSLLLSAQAAVGSTPWHSAGNSGVQPGYHQTNVTWTTFEEAKVPFSSAPTPTAGVVAGVFYTYVLDSGNYMLSALTLVGDRLIVRGAAVLYVDGSFTLSGGEIVIQPSATLKLYVNGKTATLDGKISNPGTAANFVYYGLSSNEIINWSGEYGPLVGLIYAPDATFILGNPTSQQPAEIQGAIVVRQLSITGNVHIHCDESFRR